MTVSRSGGILLRLLPALLATGLLAFAATAPAMAQAAKSASPADVEQGHHLFNSQCAHCHGEDAAAEDDYYNLPQLLSDKNDAFFFSTVKKGLPDKGMPPWDNVLKPRQIADLLAYIRSLEREQGLGDNPAPQ